MDLELKKSERNNIICIDISVINIGKAVEEIKSCKKKR